MWPKIKGGLKTEGFIYMISKCGPNFEISFKTEGS